MQNLRRGLLIIVALTLSTGVVQAAGTTTSVDISPDGDAQWTVEVREPLDTAAEENAFRSLAQGIESSNSTESFRQRLEQTISRAEERTGRPMAVRNFSVEAEIQGLTQKFGVVRYQFTWEGFARTSDGTVVVEEGLSGYYLDQGDALQVEIPEGSGVTEVEPAPDSSSDGSLRWVGPYSFSSGEPFIRVAIDGSGGVVATATESPVEGEGDGGGTDLVRIFSIALAIVLVAGFVLHRLGTWGRKGSPLDDLEAPLPDEDQVIDILRNRGGRMRQAELVEETGWSEAKVSNVTNALKEMERIEKKRWGRENILILRGPDAEGLEEEEGLEE